MEKLVIYDTSNFVDFPIGGQLTSVRNFLTYLAECQKDFCPKVLLVGLTNNEDELGKIRKVIIGNFQFDYLPIVYRNTNLSDIKNSLRVEFLKGLFKNQKLIPHGKNVIHYIHSPEAFIQIKLCHPSAKAVIFSHGSFFNMFKGFRFYQNNKIIGVLFNVFIKWMLKKANLIFVLDDDSMAQYTKYNKNVIKVNNSIVLPDKDYIRKNPHDPMRLLFVGRLSKVKRVDGIIRAVERENFNATLTIVGDGEERNYLQSIANTDKVLFKGALKPDDVKTEMEQSDILVMNSILEGKPMTIIEAMSYGLPVITTDVGGISELVEFGKNAVKTTGKANEIVEGCRLIMRDYHYFSKNALAASKQFDYKKVNEIIYKYLVNIYES